MNGADELDPPGPTTDSQVDSTAEAEADSGAQSGDSKQRSSARGRSGRADTLDPDRLAELEREREFLLASLDDLDAEFEAGDLDEVDYRGLTDDYTRRIAEVIRAIDERRAAFAAVESRLSTRQRALTFVGVVIVAVLAGVLLARASGFRAPSDSVSGDIRQSSASLLAEADTLTREGEWPEALAIYEEVLDISPANVEALTYRGWLTARLGDEPAGLLDIAEAIAVDPEYPDARVFSAILLDDAQRFEEAAADLAVLDSLDTPDQMLGLIQASGLRSSVAAGQLAERFAGGEDVDLSEINAPLIDIAQAALVLDNLDPVLAFRVFDAVLAEDPGQLLALVGKGRRIGIDADLFASAPDVAAEGLRLLDLAVEAAPDNAEVRLYRAMARSTQDQPEAALEDIAVIDRDALPEELLPVYDQIAVG